MMTARRRFVAVSVRNNGTTPQRVAAASAPVMTTRSRSMRTVTAAVAGTHRRSICTANASWFRTSSTAAATSAPVRCYGAWQQQQSFSRRSYSTTASLAAGEQTLEAAAATTTTTGRSSRVVSAATDQWRELLFGGILAVTLSATLVLGFPDSASAAPATADDYVAAVSTATDDDYSSSSSSSKSKSPPHVTFLNTPKISNKNGGVHTAASTKTVPRAIKNSGRAPYGFSVRAIRGARMTMEDRFFVASGGKFAAVFDGHGGAGVSEYLKDHLYDNVCRYLQLKHWEESDDTINNCRGAIPSVSSQAAALRAAFEQVEVDVIADDSLKYVGSTAVAVVVHEGEDGHRTLMSANVGDSRAILSRKGKAVNLTRDHKPSDEREKARILAMGEEIEWDNFSKVHRVRSLSLSRAIGDRYAKPAVSSEVEIRHFSVAEEGDDFVLLASDGLWDVMTSQEVVNFVRERLDPDGQWVDQDEVEDVDMYLRDNMAKFVAREGIRRGSGDNICVVLVFLNDPKKKKMPVIV